MHANKSFKLARNCAVAGLIGLITALTPHLALGQNGGSNPMISDFLKIYNFTADKMVQLADAMPSDAYDWRPSQEVRSVKEVLLHTASANYFFSSQLGGTIPDGINPQAMEKADMSKQEIIGALSESIKFVESTLQNITPDDMNAQVKLMGSEYNKRQLVFIIGDHVAEHLGQLIAYARSNGVTPPWSQGQ